MPWFHAVAERDHVLQNPTSPEKIMLLGEHLRLGPGSDLVDLACGKAGPAVLLAERFGSRITGVERAAEFAAAARAHVSAAGLEESIEIVEQDALDFPLEAERHDAALCLGASFVWGGLAETLAALTPSVRPGGHVVVGEVYWQRPVPSDYPDGDGGWVSLAETLDRFASAGLALTAVIASSVDDWDRYESLHWRALEDWLGDHPDDPDAPEIRRRHLSSRERYLRWDRDLLGWAILAGRKVP